SLPAMSPPSASVVGKSRGARKRAPRLRDELDVPSLGALVPLGLVELDLRALGERLEAVSRDRAEVDEHVLAAGVRGNEAVALRVVEPLDGSGCHGNTSLHGALERAGEA